MPTYLIISPHTTGDCLKIIDNVLASGYLTHFQWGCRAGDHTGYVIFEANNKSEALMVVPSFVREKAKAIELTQFTPEQVTAMHDKKT